jgi:DNA polymerase III delta prime subunit
LNRVLEALDWFDPATEGRRLPAREDSLIVDPLTLQTLRRVLADPSGLGPLAPPEDLKDPPASHLSEAQWRAVALAVRGPDLLLIQGPPGTGKTTVIVEILRQLFRLHGSRREFKVLLVAPTHVAVDNVLERLVAPRDGRIGLAAELGITPYRLGATRRIARHLQGFTHDCFHSSYVQQLEDAIAAEVGSFGDSDLDEQVRAILLDGARADTRGWAAARRSGEWPASRPTRWPTDLPAEWQEAVRTQDGRARLWRRHAPVAADDPEPRRQLLRDWLGFVRQNQELFNQLQLTGANLVCATTVGCATSSGLRGLRYDYVIVDEAGKEEARKLLVPLIRGDHWVLVGDQEQLPPYVDRAFLDRAREAGIPEDVLTRSLFEELQPALRKCGRFVFLDRQGRMHPDISAFVSHAFYNDELEDFDGAGVRDLPGPDWLPDAPALQLLDTRGLEERGEVRLGKGYANPLEVELTVRLLRAFASLPSWEGRRLGAIAPYRKQVEALEEAVKADDHLAGLLRDGLLQVGTVDSFQGQERELIVFSCTRSNPGGRLEFVDNRQRLNVALSRARARLLVVGDGDTIARSGGVSDMAADEAEVRRGLVGLLDHVRATGGLVPVPTDWREEWQ